jgi:hypothetical protein
MSAETDYMDFVAARLGELSPAMQVAVARSQPLWNAARRKLERGAGLTEAELDAVREATEELAACFLGLSCLSSDMGRAIEAASAAARDGNLRVGYGTERMQ